MNRLRESDMGVSLRRFKVKHPVKANWKNLEIGVFIITSVSW